MLFHGCVFYKYTLNQFFYLLNLPLIKLNTMKLILFKIIAKLNKFILPSLSKKRLDLSKANKFELALFVWKLFITKNVINQ